jgi:hypothetical protein
VEPDQLSELRAWADRLEERAETEETRAEARAIRMLVDEVESLQRQLAGASSAARPETDTSLPVFAPAASPAPDSAPTTTEVREAPGADEPAWAAADDRLSGSFFSRVKRTFGFD